jgi:predicted amidohydrolase YtcJ
LLLSLLILIVTVPEIRSGELKAYCPLFQAYMSKLSGWSETFLDIRACKIGAFSFLSVSCFCIWRSPLFAYGMEFAMQSLSPDTMSAKRFIDGKIFTSCDATELGLQESMLIYDGKVVCVGSETHTRAQSSKVGVSFRHSANLRCSCCPYANQLKCEIEEIDLKQRVVLPGIIDGHTHLVMLGGSLNKVNMLGLSIKEIQDALCSARYSQPECQMILGRSFLLDALGQRPHRKFLDEILPDIPVFIDSADLHSTWLNTAAIQALGITKDTPNPKGGVFEKDAHGELTGLFLETATAEYVWPYLASRLTVEDRLKYLQDTFDEYLATGVTGAVEMALEELDLKALEIFYKRHNNSLPMRITAHWLISPSGTPQDRHDRVVAAVQHKERLSNCAPWLRLAGIKIISDGVVDSCTAYCTKPYFDGTTADPIWPRAELLETVALADKHGLQVAVHAIGDAAVDMALDAFEHAIKINGDIHRLHRIEHLEVVTKDSIARLTRLGIVASLQPVHADPVYLPNWQKMVGYDERMDRAFPWSEYVEANSKVAFGSDAPTAPHHCFPNMYTATTRQSGVNPALPPSDDHRIRALAKWCVGLDVAIRNYTLGSAYACQADAYSGSLEPGKSADFCILGIDPFRDGVNTLREAQTAVTQTWLNGEIVFQKSDVE